MGGDLRQSYSLTVSVLFYYYIYASKVPAWRSASRESFGKNLVMAILRGVWGYSTCPANRGQCVGFYRT
jgi:hypothetical protein